MLILKGFIPPFASIYTTEIFQPGNNGEEILVSLDL
jgi:hypothetical protein